MKAHFIRGIDPKDAMNTGDKWIRWHQKIESAVHVIYDNIKDDEGKVSYFDYSNKEHGKIWIGVGLKKYEVGIKFSCDNNEIYATWSTVDTMNKVVRGTPETQESLSDAITKLEAWIESISRIIS